MTPDDPPTGPLEDAPSPDRVDAALERVETWFEDADCPGASVALADRAEVLAASGFGERTRYPSAHAPADTR